MSTKGPVYRHDETRFFQSSSEPMLIESPFEKFLGCHDGDVTIARVLEARGDTGRRNVKGLIRYDKECRDGATVGLVELSRRWGCSEALCIMSWWTLCRCWRRRRPFGLTVRQLTPIIAKRAAFSIDELMYQNSKSLGHPVYADIFTSTTSIQNHHPP